LPERVLDRVTALVPPSVGKVAWAVTMPLYMGVALGSIGAVVGGTIGCLGGPVGLVAGGLSGAAAGGSLGTVLGAQLALSTLTS
jgi:hypothetical protein